MRKMTTILLAAAATLAIAPLAHAQADRPERGTRAAEMTRDAAISRADAMFGRLDINSDGRIDAADREARQRARFDRADANGDGAVTFEETSAMREQRQERLGERRAMRQERRAARKAQGGEAPRMARRGEMAGAPDGAMRPRRAGGLMMRGTGNADANGDGAITKAEFTNAALTRFDAADTDRNGVVTREERRGSMRDRRDQRS